MWSYIYVFFRLMGKYLFNPHYYMYIHAILLYRNHLMRWRWKTCWKETICIHVQSAKRKSERKRGELYLQWFLVSVILYITKWRQKSGILNDGYNKNNFMMPLVGLMIFSRRWFYMHLGYPKLFDGNVTLSLKTLSVVI